MFDTLQTDPGPDAATSEPGPGVASVPLERLEAEICEVAGHLAAAPCRFLVLLGDFDARRGWAGWEMNSCAQWLSWKCQMSSGTAREHVRVARALRDLPVIRGEFAAGRLSYAKVRALTRIATPVTEAGLADLAGPMTGNQLERFARAHRQVSSVDDAAAKVRRRLAFRFEEDGSLAGTFRLPPLQGAVLLKALRAAAGDLAHPHAADGEHSHADGDLAHPHAADEEHPHPAGPQDPEDPHEGSARDVSAETPAGDPAPAGDQVPAADSPAKVTSTSLADALLVIAEAFLAGKVAGADDPEVYQVILHVGTDTMTPAASPAGPASPAAEGGDVSAETRPAASGPPGSPARPG